MQMPMSGAAAVLPAAGHSRKQEPERWWRKASVTTIRGAGAAGAVPIRRQTRPMSRADEPNLRPGRWHGAAAAAWLAVSGLQAADSDIILRVQQATDISVTPGGAERIITDIGGRLWSVPRAGGTATPLSAAGEYARRPTLSPDGMTLAYETLQEGFFQVMLMDAAGGNVRPATVGDAQHLAPSWSPDGRRLAFASDRGGDFAIWELEIDSGALRQLTFEAGAELDPAWSPADGTLAYISERGGRSALMMLVPGATPRTLVSSLNPLRAPAWRPDGSVISFVEAQPQGPRLQMAILSSPVVVKPAARAEAAIEAPAKWLDRNRLLYTADGGIRIREMGALSSTEVPFEATLELSPAKEPPAGRLNETEGAVQARGTAGLAPLGNGQIIVSTLGDLWTVDRQGAPVRQLTRDAFVDRDPAVSPDGRWLAYTSDRSGNPQVWLMDLGTLERRAVTQEDESAGHPAWHSTGERVAYLASETGNAFTVKVLDIGRGATTLAGTGLVEPGTPAWSPDGTTLAAVQNRQGNPQLLFFAADGTATRRVTLPAAVTGSGAHELQWSGDGKKLLIASSAGVYTLPMLDSGLVGADWQQLSDQPVQFARWVPGNQAVLVADTEGLARIAIDGTATQRIALAISWQPATAAGQTIVRASRVFDGQSGTYLYDHDVVIEGRRITAIRPWSADLAGATLVDARGKTVMPGLIDLAVRLSDRAGERLGRTLLAYGVTTVQVPAAAGAELREVAERWQAHAAGPRLLRSAEWCGEATVAPLPGVNDGALRLCPTAIGHLRPLLDPLRITGAPFWSSSWLSVLSGRVHVVSPGIPSERQPLLGTTAGLNNYYQDAIDALARSGVTLVPGLATRGLPYLVDEQPDLLAARQYQRLFSDAERAAQSRAWLQARLESGTAGRTGLRLRQRSLGQLMAAGGRMAAASNAPTVPYGLGLQAEIRLLAGIGLPADRVLAMATSEAARALGLQEEIGTLRVGLRADLLILDGDPVRNPGDLLRIEAVMSDGVLRRLDDLLPADPALEKFTLAPQPIPAKNRRKQR